MNTVKFNSPEYGDIKVAGIPEMPLFCIQDICRIFNLELSHVAKDLDESDMLVSDNATTFVTLNGVIDILSQVSHSDGRKFRKWIMNEIIPQSKNCLKDESLKMTEIMQCLKDVIIDYPLCAIESDDADMDQVHYNVSVLSRFYFLMKGKFNNDNSLFSSICK